MERIVVEDRNCGFKKVFKDDLPSSLTRGSSIDVPHMNHGCSTTIEGRTSLDKVKTQGVVSMALTGTMRHFLRIFKPEMIR
ncbi:hypothetical protein [Parachryseolinea silvisoli]|uniref:hypothetical protein n=1 Tax=Parachryseolinea silvisoli TaxID=2873601 RepID=UPI002265B112|nr:hypothetical protein [Parachryseolinea silvisoli]MCD9019286.1 hypothetical protein [Parachryseolinea silvisoli]